MTDVLIHPTQAQQNMDELRVNPFFFLTSCCHTCSQVAVLLGKQTAMGREHVFELLRGSEHKAESNAEAELNLHNKTRLFVTLLPPSG